MSAYRTLAEVQPTLTPEEEREFFQKCTMPASPSVDARSVLLGCVCLSAAIAIRIAAMIWMRL
jgi:hypothetical protein